MSHAEPDAPAPVRDADGRFLRGPGRKRGSRNRFSRALAMAVLEDFAENRAAVLKQLRYNHLQTYAAMVSRLLPRDIEEEGEDAEGEIADGLLALPPAAEAPDMLPIAEVHRAMDRIERQVLAQYLAHEREV
jgi:hypothetical protein